MTVEPVKSQQDQKSYKRLKLDNGLDVLMIHDPEMEASSSADADAHMTTDDEDDRDVSNFRVACSIPLRMMPIASVTGTCPSELYRVSQGNSEDDDESMDDNADNRQHIKKVGRWLGGQILLTTEYQVAIGQIFSRLQIWSACAGCCSYGSWCGKLQRS